MIYSGNSFFDRQEVKDVMAYLKLAVNLNDDESFKRVVNKPARGIGDTSLSALAAAALELKTSLFKAAFAENLESFGLKAPAIKKIREFCLLMNTLAVKAQSEDAYAVACEIAMSTGILMFYKGDTSIEGQARAANVEELLNGVKSYVEERQSEMFEEMQADGLVDEGVEIASSQMPAVTLIDYLENVSLLSAVDVDDEEDGNNKISMMTVHSSKGLEYPYVYVVGMEENLFPSGGWLVSESDVEEERRLFYVAMTRAKKVLQLSFAQTRMRNGKTESNSPSRFIREIDTQYILNPLSADDSSGMERQLTSGSWRSQGGQSSSRYGNTYGRSSLPVTERRPVGQRQASTSVSKPAITSSPQPVSRPQTVSRRVPDAEFEPTPILQLRPGDRIEHNRFGLGRIVEISGEVVDLKAKIQFDDHGEKILILKYAKIRKV
jgi:DNA helicase-2/ATP-dependent DNA helicase PcrA